MRRLTLLASINGFTGYGLHAIQIARDIHEAHVQIRPVSQSEAFGCRIPMDIRQRFVNAPQPEEWELLLHPPNFGPTQGKKTAYFSMWESTRLPAMGVMLLNKAEVVIVPCEWCASCFSAAGVERPIYVVPLGINREIFDYRPLPRESQGLCVFGTAGRMAHGGVRKGINEVIELFQRAFEWQKDVRLLVKCWPDCPVNPVKDKRIEITRRYLSESEMAGWFGRIHCFVSAARAEGWGLMQQQAMSVGRPVMGVNFGGVREFFRHGYEVPHRLRPAQGEYKGCGLWAEPDEEAIIAGMREIYGNREEALRRGAMASESVSRYTWQNSNRKLAEVLKELGAL